LEIYERAGVFQRVVRRTASTRLMAKIYGRIQQPLDRLVFRLTRGRTTLSAWLSGITVVMLTTTGARSGQPRTLPVVGLVEAERVIVIASNFGRARNPGWYHNLRAHPRASVRVDGATRGVEAHELPEAEAERYLEYAARYYPGFARYREWSGRRIPVLSLVPVARGTE
jgi:deazaflavin-dependent oxidoreductase (nitroreductase family)